MTANPNMAGGRQSTSVVCCVVSKTLHPEWKTIVRLRDEIGLAFMPVCSPVTAGFAVSRCSAPWHHPCPEKRIGKKPLHEYKHIYDWDTGAMLHQWRRFRRNKPNGALVMSKDILAVEADCPEAAVELANIIGPGIVTPTRSARPGRGAGYLFRVSEEFNSHTGVGVTKDIDVKAEGGILVAYGVHYSGWEIRWELSPLDVPIAPAPPSLVAWLRGLEKQRNNTTQIVLSGRRPRSIKISQPTAAPIPLDPALEARTPSKVLVVVDNGYVPTTSQPTPSHYRFWAAIECAHIGHTDDEIAAVIQATPRAATYSTNISHDIMKARAALAKQRREATRVRLRHQKPLPGGNARSRAQFLFAYVGRRVAWYTVPHLLAYPRDGVVAAEYVHARSVGDVGYAVINGKCIERLFDK